MNTVTSPRQTNSAKMEKCCSSIATPPNRGVTTQSSPPQEAGNLALQRLFQSGQMQAKLEISQSNDPLEKEADDVADKVLSIPETIGTQKINKSSDTTTGMTQSHVTTSSGRPLGQATRSFYEHRFGHDFSEVRVHDGPAASALTKSLQARAYTVGRDVVFGENQYRPLEPVGKHLLAHELTHVVQQRGGTRPRIDRQQTKQELPHAGDFIQAVGPFFSGSVILTGGESLIALADPVGNHIRVQLPPPYMHAYEPFDIPVSLVMGGVTSSEPTITPPTDLLNYAVDLGPSSLLPDIPEGIVVEIDPTVLPAAALSRAMQGGTESGSFDMRGWPISQAGRLTGALADQRLMSQGFNAAGPYAIGMVGYPNTTNLRALTNLDVPQSPILFGHTITFVRADGRIITMTSFGPKSLVASGLDALTGSNAGVPGNVIQHLNPQPFPLSLSGTHGFPNTSGVSVEWPVTAEMARRMSNQLAGAQGDDLAKYAAYTEKCQGSQNCVGWALDQVERELGGPVGQQGQPPLRHQSGANTARQGRFQGMVDDALIHQQSGGTRGTLIADMPNATGPATVGKMSGKMRVIKWGGRLLEVGGYAFSIYRISNSSNEEMPFVVAEEALGSVAGPLGGVVGELYIAPMREVAAGRGDATLLILPIPYIAPLVRIIEPEKQDPEGGRLIRRAVLDNDPDACFELVEGLFGGGL